MMYVSREEFEEYKRRSLAEQMSTYDMIAKHLDRLEAMMEERFTRMEERFDQMDQRFDQMDQRFDRMDERFDRLEARFDKASADFADHREDDAARFDLVKIELSLLHKGQARMEKTLTDIDARLYRLETKELR